MKSKELDQFYTNPVYSDRIIKLHWNKWIKNLNISSDYVILEPSAGGGNFIKSLQKHGVTNKIFAYDIDPIPGEHIVKKDFLKLKRINKKPDSVVTIGNPPFGKRGSLALEFVNKSLEHSDLVMLILPIQFNKWLLQKQVNSKAKLIYYERLLDESFLHNNKEYSVRTGFYIFYKGKTNRKDLRLKSAPKITHPDFEAFIHNNTKNTRKYFNKNKYKWSFAIHRQGYYNYNEIIRSENHIRNNANKQWIFIKPRTKVIEQKLLKLDFEKLSKLNTSTPGFGKADLITEYTKKYSK